jgi:hypothetical protein
MVTQGPESRAFSELKTDFLSKRKIQALSTRSQSPRRPQAKGFFRLQIMLRLRGQVPILTA